MQKIRINGWEESIGRMNRFIAFLAINIGKVILSEHDQRVLLWKINKLEKLRFDYKHELNENSIVFDLGGYKGDWTQKIFSKYHCYIYVFEPVKTFAEVIKKRFKNERKIKVYHFGLSNKTQNIYMVLEDDKTSAFKHTNKKIRVRIVNIKEFLKENKIKEIDLMKINIEGGEYDLLDYIISERLIKKIKNIQVQFHQFVVNAKERMITIQNKLSETHEPTYQYKFIWENWRRKE